MAVIGEAIVEVKPDAKGFGPDVERNVLAQVKGIAAKAAVIMGGAFAVRGGIQFFGGALEEAEEARKTMALTEAVLKSTGGTAGVTADSLSDLAGRLSNVAAVDDELIQSAGNVLLTFTNVQNKVGEGNDVYDQGVEAALNMSAALGTDLQGATLQLGKALNDPIKGITALSRAGVSFTEEQKEQIKTLVASGDTLGAQKIILAELNKEFAGAAEAAAPPLERLKVTYGNLKESLGTAIVPGLTAALPGIQTAVEGLTPTFTALGDTLGSALGTVAPILTDAIGPIATTFADTFGSVVEAVSPALEALSGAFSETFATLGPAITDTITPIAGALGNIFATIGPPLIGALGNIFEQLGPVLGDVLATLGELFTNGIGPIVQALGPVVREVATVLGDTLGPVIEQLGPVLGEIASTIGSAFAQLAPVIGQVVTALAGGLGDALGAIVPVLGDLLTALAPVVTALVDAFAPVLPVIGKVLGEVAGIVAGTFGKALQAAMPLVETLAEVMVDLAPVIGDIAELLVGALGEALKGLAPLFGVLLPPLAEVASTLVEALAPILPTIADLVLDVLDAFLPLIDALAPLLGLIAPIADLLGGVLAVALEAIAPLLEVVADLLGGALGVALDAITPLIELFADALAGVVDFLANIFQGNWSEAWHAIRDVAVGVWDAVTGAVRAGWDFITGIFGSIGSFLSDTWSKAWNGLSDITSNVLDSVVGFVTGLPGRIASAVSGLWDSLGDGFKAVVNSIISLWNKLDFGLGPWKIPDWVPIVGGKSFGIKDIFPDIPLLAYGDVVDRPTLGIFGEAGPEVVLPLSNRKRLIELLVQAIGRGGALPAFAGGAIFAGGTLPSSGDVTANLDGWRRLVEALMRVAEIDPSALTGSGIAVPDEDAWQRLTDAAREAGVALTDTTERALIPLGAFIEEAGLVRVAGSNLGDDYAVNVTAPPSSSLDDPFFVRSFAGIPWAQLAMLARREDGADVRALGLFAAALGPPTTGQEFYKGLVYDRESGRVLGWRRSDEDPAENPLLRQPPSGWRVPSLLMGEGFSAADERALVNGIVAQVAGRAAPLFLSRELMNLIRQEQDSDAGLVRPTLADFVLTDRGLQGRTVDAHWQGAHALGMIPGARSQVNEDGTAVALLPGNVIVKFANEPPGSFQAPSTALDPAAQVLETRRAWAWLQRSGVLSSGVSARSIDEGNLARLIGFLPYWVRQAVLAAGYLPSSFGPDERAALDLPSFLARVARLGDGGIVQPRAGGTLAFLAERGQAEAILPLPSGLLDSLTANAQAPTTIDRSLKIERATFDLGNVRDPYRVPSALWSEAESIVWKNGA